MRLQLQVPLLLLEELHGDGACCAAVAPEVMALLCTGGSQRLKVAKLTDAMWAAEQRLSGPKACVLPCFWADFGLKSWDFKRFLG